MATNKTKRGGRKKRIQKILGDLYYSPNQPAAFGGAGKLVQAAKTYGIKKATVLSWLQLKEVIQSINLLCEILKKIE